MREGVLRALIGPELAEEYAATIAELERERIEICHGKKLNPWERDTYKLWNNGPNLDL